MTHIDLAFRNFVVSLETAHDEIGFKGAAERLAARLGYRWFAYLGFSEPALKVLSSFQAHGPTDVLPQEALEVSA